MLGKDPGLGRREEAVEAAQHRQRQDDLAVLVPLVWAAEQVADAPDEVGELGVGLGVQIRILDVEVRAHRQKDLARQDASQNRRHIYRASRNRHQ